MIPKKFDDQSNITFQSFKKKGKNPHKTWQILILLFHKLRKINLHYNDSFQNFHPKLVRILI